MISLDDLLCVTGARLVRGDRALCATGVCTDTRDPALKGALFVALKGDRFDGHDYLNVAADAGAAAALVDRRHAAAPGVERFAAVVSVSDTTAALGEWAARHRRRLDARIIAVTGSSGKTSTKGFLEKILSTTYRVVAAKKSFNNHIGVPLTLLAMDETTQVGVLELGMNHPGEIAALTKICDPDIGVITSIGSAHAGAFSSERQIARAKGEMLEHGSRMDVALLPASTPYLPTLKRLSRAKQVVTFGLERGANVRGVILAESRNRTRLRIGSDTFELPFVGRHMVSNVVASAAVARLMAVEPATLRRALASLDLPAGRGDLIRIGSRILIDESYNANPASCAAALDRVRLQFPRLKKYLVLGEMLELGRHSSKYHRQLGMDAARLKPAWVVYAGSDKSAARAVMRGLALGGVGRRRVFCVDSAAEACEKLGALPIQTHAVLLVKGSRRIGLDDVVKRAQKLLTKN